MRLPRKKIEHDKQEALRKVMKEHGWLTKKMHGNAYQSGIPDLYCIHPVYGARWVEMKKSYQDRLTPDQIRVFGELSQYGAKIWILMGPENYQWLFMPSNWQQWLAFNH